MDKQQDQMNQNLNQEVEYISGFLEEEVVDDSDFNEPVEDQEKADDLAENLQNEQQEKEQPKKIKRPRKTIEQEIAELDAKRERLMEKKRRQEAHEKIVFGAASIKVLKTFCHKKENQNGWEKWKNELRNAVIAKDKDILEKVIYNIENE